MRKIKKATRDELDIVHKEYEALMASVRGMSPVGLFLIALAGIAVVLYFTSNLLDLVGLALMLYPLYVFIRRGAHREGYFEGYYDLMTKAEGRMDHPEPKE